MDFLLTAADDECETNGYGGNEPACLTKLAKDVECRRVCDGLEDVTLPTGFVLTLVVVTLVVPTLVVWMLGVLMLGVLMLVVLV